MNVDNLIKDIRSWKTTLIGWLTGSAMIIPQLIAIIDSDPETVFSLPVLLAGLAAIGIGTAAKDGDKSTEDIG